MAAEIVAEAFLSSFVETVFERLSSPEFVNLIRGKKLNLQKLLGRMKTTLFAAQALLNDAEQRQIKERAVKDWLDSLKDAVYVADDLLDEVSTKAATQKDAGNFLSRYLNLQDRETANRLEDIIDTLDSIVKHKDTLGLKDIPMESMSWRVPSTSLVEISDIYGRDKDKEAIIELLLDDTCDAKLPVISIVGIGGIGKTTLAQLVYNNDKVKGNFNFRAWVCAAEKFDVMDVTKTIIEALTSCPCNMNNFDLLQTDLKEKLTGKTFLIVLDDMWNDRPDVWKTLLKPFQCGNKGSKLLVTTRSEKVAFVMPTIPPYKLSLLSDEDCWSIFLKHSFLSTECREYATLELIGREIVKKCKGLPLAAETLGGLLCAKCDVRDWNQILKSEIWEFSEDESRIMPALRISYHYLPSHLKRCFVYCSLYPKDYLFDKDELILLWMAEDHLQQKGRETLEEIGCVYFNELVARSFFQPSRYDNLFVMHDLMHDLATFCAGEFYFKAEELGNAIEIGSKTRHLSYNVRGNYPISKLLAACHGVKHMRTFVGINLKPWLIFNMKIDPFNTENAPCILLSTLKYLRVLSFKSFPLESLPDSIGELVHLRYLDVSRTPIVTLPESLSNLYKLQTLKLHRCDKLKMLPSGMHHLVNLRHLDIRYTSLKEMPEGMSKLKELQLLSYYIVGKNEENKIRELGPLANLHGSLRIDKLENVINSREAAEARILDKKHINILNLRWSSNSSFADSQIERDILNKLQPHTELKELLIRGYRGTIFPDWLGDSSYRNMTHLTLSGSENCCMLPSLGQLPSLKALKISHFPKLLSIGAEFYGGDESCRETPFPSLETLEFIRLDCWREWRSFEFSAFPQLKQLIIRYCPLLIGDLPDHLPALEKLTIDRESKQLACSLPRAPAILELSVKAVNVVRMQELPLSLLRSLSVSGCQLVEYVFEAMTHAQPTCLQSLSISSCSSVVSFPGDCMPASLQLLKIRHCEKLDFPMPTQQQQRHELLQTLKIFCSCDSLISFPLYAFPNLRALEIMYCKNMKCLVASRSQDAAILSLRSLTIFGCTSFVSFSTLGMAAPRLEHLEIGGCPKIDSFPEGGLPPNLSTLHINRCEKLASCLVSMGLRSPGLTRLHITGTCEGVKSLPNEGCLPASLETLRFSDFSGLEMLDCKGLLHLTSLKALRIEDCPKLENMTEGTLPASLTYLSIEHCPLLGERCQMKDSQIWPRISHVPRVHVDGKQIF